MSRQSAYALKPRRCSGTVGDSSLMTLVYQRAGLTGRAPERSVDGAVTYGNVAV